MGSNLRSAGHLGGRRSVAVARLTTTPDLMEPYLVLCCSKFQGHGTGPPTPVQWTPGAMRRVSHITPLHEACYKKVRWPGMCSLKQPEVNNVSMTWMLARLVLLY